MAAYPLQEALRLEGVTVGVKKKKLLSKRPCIPTATTVLHDVSTSLVRGGLNAVMGPSGCGKTSLLLTIAGRFPATKTKGVAYLNMGDKKANDDDDGEEGADKKEEEEDEGMSMKKLMKWGKDHVGFVSTEDHLWPFLTIKETLRLAALMYLPSCSFSIAEKLKRADTLIRVLKLKHVANVRVGSSQSKLISGGETRRVSLGVALLTSPSILLLDEPTSGLDSVAAETMVRVLRKLARKGQIIAATIHQPTEETFKLFDHILFLKAGTLVYDGHRKDAQKFFEKQGAIFLKGRNPPDIMMDWLSSHNVVELTGDDKEDKEGIEMTERAKESSSSSISGKETESESETESEDSSSEDSEKESASEDTDTEDEEEESSDDMDQLGKPLKHRDIRDILWSFVWLACRELLALYRVPKYFVVQLMLHVMVPITLGTLWFDIDASTEALARGQAISLVAVYLLDWSVLSAYRMVGDHATVRWEIWQGMYKALPFFLVRVSIETVLTTSATAIYGTMWYWIVDYDHDVAGYYYFLMMTLLVSMCATSWARLLAFIAPSPSTVVLLYALSTLVFTVVSGWFVPYPNLPSFWKGIFWTHPVSYYTMGTMQYELNKNVQGTFFLDNVLGFPVDGHYYAFPLALLGFFFLYIFISFFAFRFLHRSVTL